MTSPQPEPWLRGPLPGIPGTLQPAAHAFVLAKEDVEAALEGLTDEQLWARPGGAASIGFHVAHLAGATDRLLTYARGEMLNDAQKAAAAAEKALETTRPSRESLLAGLQRGVAAALEQLSKTADTTLLDAREVGRAKLPTTVLGAIFHAAEHAARHAGQVVTTAKVVRGDQL